MALDLTWDDLPVSLRSTGERKTALDLFFIYLSIEVVRLQGSTAAG